MKCNGRTKKVLFNKVSDCELNVQVRVKVKFRDFLEHFPSTIDNIKSSPCDSEQSGVESV